LINDYMALHFFWRHFLC